MQTVKIKAWILWVKRLQAKDRRREETIQLAN
jgi:hypothetical protein